MAVTKKTVPLSAIVPSEANPRRDFGDIHALADTVRATGGEPVNPPVVVEDGNVFRIVDGERRYRALREVWAAEPDRAVTVLVAEDMDSANELVAMLATDDKQPLTEAERAAGVQQMLLLGVDTETVARSARTTRGKVTAMKMVGAQAPGGVQVTLDQALAASELPEEYAARVLAAEDWEAEERRVRAEIRSREAERTILAALEGTGWEVFESDAEACEGHRYVGRVRPEWAEGDVEKLAAMGACRASLSGSTCYVYAPAPDEDEAEAARAELQRAKDEDKAACLDMARSMAAFLAGGGLEGADCAAELFDLARAFVKSDVVNTYRFGHVLELLPDMAELLDGANPGLFNIHLALLRKISDFADGTYGWRGEPDADRMRALADAYDLMGLCGWRPSDGHAAKRAEAREALDGSDD